METVLLHTHGLLASDRNFKEQMEVDLGLPQYAVNYRPFVEGKWKHLIDSIVHGIVQVLHDQFPNKNFVLHGNSAGGFLVALITAHPEMYQKVVGVVLNCSAWLLENLEGGDSSAAFALSSSAKSDPTKIYDLIELFVQLPKDKIPERLVDEIKDFALWDDSRAQLAKFWRRWQLFKNDAQLVSSLFKDWLAYIRQQSIPTLVIWGSNDLITPPSVIEEMARLLGTNANMLSAWHAPHIEVSQLFNNMLRGFVIKNI